MYKFLCNDNKYESYQYVETKTFQPIDNLSICPKKTKLFVNDVFDYNETNKKIILIHSNFKSNKMVPGILSLTTTHGKENNKFLYLCKPDDKRIPFFLIPYTKPQKFDKSIQKIYILFEFKHWDYKHPYGIMKQNLGNINILVNYYEYILYCKTLNISIQTFTKEVKQKLQYKSNEEIIDTISKKHNLEIRSKKDYYIFTLDSCKSNDYDDAISFCEKDNKLSIYISNVALIMDELDLWNAFSNRISTIYLPDKKRTMLPSALIDMICSLKQKEYKLCYVLDIYFDNNKEIISYSFCSCKAYIRKNVYYESISDFKENKSFKKILELLNLKHSKQIVTKLMIMFNHYVGRSLKNHIDQKGIYKSLYQETSENKLPENIPKHIYDYICILKNKSSYYSLYNPSLVYKSIIHNDIEIYAQATSPIRRLVDLLNNIVIINNLTSNKISSRAISFYDKWTSKENMENINISSRTIRKIQSKCFIYEQYEKNKEKNINPLYKGYVFDKMYKKGDNKYQYMVYIDILGLTTSVTLIDELTNYTCHMFSLYVFMSEENDKKKIKLQLCYENKERI